MEYDVLFIGSGRAAFHAALTLAAAGKKVGMIERDLVAGTCPNYGCDPKILLEGPFQLVEQLKRYQGIGVDEVPTVNWQQLMAYKHSIIDPLPEKLEKRFASQGVEILHGEGSLQDAHTVLVDGTPHSADYIVIGTGARAAKLNIPGNEYIHDSREFLDIEELPQRLTFIGSGIIAMEFAAMAATSGREVHIIEFGDQALKAFNPDHVDQLVKRLEAEGVQFHFNQAVNEVSKTADGLEVKTADGLTIQTDYIVGATGRAANIEGLNLDKLGIEASARGIKVNDHHQTVVENIYASGDVIDKTTPKLTPTAIFDSNYVADQILGIDDQPIDYPVIPSVVFTAPRLAEVGVTVPEAKAHPDQYRIEEVDYAQQEIFEFKNETDARATFIFDQQTGAFVGASLIGNSADELINALTMAINDKMTRQSFNRQIFVFPGAVNGILTLLAPFLPAK